MKNRMEAIKAGDKFYASTCKRCGECVRRVDSGSCVRCAKSRRKNVYHAGKVKSDSLTFKSFCKCCNSETDHYSSNRNCKPCSNARSMDHYLKNRTEYIERFKDQYQKNKSERMAKNRNWYEQNKVRLKKYYRQYRIDNAEKIALWRKSESAMAAHRQRQNKKYKTPHGKASMAARNMVYRIMTGTRCGKASSQLGYSTDDLIKHLESMFCKGMSWDNYGEWHIDHIVPVSFLLENGVNDVCLINSLKNLRPLWAAENISKHDHYDGRIEDAIKFLEGK